MIVLAKLDKRPYTPADDAAIRSCRRHGDFKRVAALLGRTHTAIVNRAQAIGVRVSEARDWDEMAARAKRLHGEGVPTEQIQAELGVGRSRLYELLKGQTPKRLYRCESCRSRVAELVDGECDACRLTFDQIHPPEPSDDEVAEFESSYAALREALGYREAARYVDPDHRPDLTNADASDEAVALYRKAWRSIRRPAKPPAATLWGVRRWHGNAPWMAIYAHDGRTYHVGTYPTEKAAHEAAVKHRNAKHGAAA